jgi:LPXTG-motif cell wall-anchored protein
VTGSPDAQVVRAVATSGQLPSAGGPPAGALFALGAVALLGGGGWLIRRRRLREERR